MNLLNELSAKIDAQTKGKEHTAVWAAGEQLKEICKETPGAAEIVLQDLDVKEMSVEECEKKIKELADERHKKNKGNFAFVSPKEADEIIRKFYGLPEAAAEADGSANGFIDLDDFI